MPGDDALSRACQAGIGAFLLLIGLCLGGVGLYALLLTPTFAVDSSFSALPARPTQIEDLDLEASFWQRFPEFFLPHSERRWWQMQEAVYQVLETRRTVTITWITRNGEPQEQSVRIARPSLTTVLKRTWLIYWVAVLYLVSAVSVFRRHRSLPGSLLAFFLLFGALYFLSAAPVVGRGITLPPRYFKLFIMALYIAAGGLITLVHFAFVFPAPKGILRRFPRLPLLCYGYFFLTVTLYLSGITAFGSTFPFLCFWTLLLIATLLHSLWTEGDRFLRKQISLSLMAPLLVGLFFILFHLLPGVLGTTPMPFTHFALFSLLLPFTLPSALDNLRLYQERLQVEHTSRQERERMRWDLHDT
ncbi:MAG: hypothetical protein D6736_17835, partial [Nitrospinota bacterium]